MSKGGEANLYPRMNFAPNLTWHERIQDSNSCPKVQWFASDLQLSQIHITHPQWGTAEGFAKLTWQFSPDTPFDEREIRSQFMVNKDNTSFSGPEDEITPDVLRYTNIYKSIYEFNYLLIYLYSLMQFNEGLLDRWTHAMNIRVRKIAGELKNFLQAKASFV